MAPPAGTGDAASGIRLARAPASAAATEAFRAAAAEATERLAFAPRLEEELRIQIVHHLEDARDTRFVTSGIAGISGADALVAFGDPWRVGVDLSRAARGKRSVAYPGTLGETFRAAAVYDAGILGLIVATILFVRLQVVTAYHIPSGSMEPTLHGDRQNGDRILVLKWSPPPRRFDIQVFDGWSSDRKHYVKRTVGLPGERIRIREGDLYVDDLLVRKDGDSLEALLFPLFDRDAEARRARDASGETRTSLQDRMEEFFASEGHERGLLHGDGSYELWAGAGKPATLRFDRTPTDALYEPRTGVTRESGYVNVSDLRFEATVTLLDGNARAALRLSRGAQVCDAVLAGDTPGVALLADGVEIARAADVVIPVGKPTRVRFSRVDHVLRLEVGGRLVLRHDFAQPENPSRGEGPVARVEGVVTAGGAKVRPERIERDIHWTSDYTAVEEDRPLGPDEYFMCGDNSANSEDSRRHGPVHGSRLVGRPILVVWPFEGFRIPR